MKLFGKEPAVWAPWAIGGAALLLLLLWLRSRSGGAAGAPSGADMSFGAGAVSPSAPAQYGATAGEDRASAFDQQLGALRLQEIQQGLKQAQAMFDLQFGQAATLGSLYTQEAQQSFAQLTTARQHTKVECGKGQSMYTDVNGNLACKGSGKSGIKSFTDSIGQGLQNIQEGFLGGVAAAAPAAGQYYGAQMFGTPGIAPKAPTQSATKQPGTSYPSVSLV